MHARPRMGFQLPSSPWVEYFKPAPLSDEPSNRELLSNLISQTVGESGFEPLVIYVTQTNY